MYIDPNTGGMLFQALAAFLAIFSGIALLFSGKIRGYIARMRRKMRGDVGETVDAAETEAGSEDPTQE